MVGLVCGSYALCLAVAVVAVFVTLVVTDGWGAARTGNAMMTMLLLDAAVFLLSAVLVFLGLTLVLDGLAWRLLIVAGYLAALVATWLLVAFMSAVLFNR